MKNTCWICCLIFLVTSPILPTDQNFIDSLYHQGLQLLQHQKPQSALTIFEQIIDADYFRPEGHYGAGLALKTIYPDSDLAVPHFKKALEMGADYQAPAYYQLGLLYQHLGLNEEAIESLTLSLRNDPNFKQRWYQLDTLTCISGEPPPEIALKYLPNLLQQNPANDTLGTLYLRTALWHSKEKKAIKELNELYQQGYCDTWLILVLIELHLNQGNYSEGLALLDSHATQLRQQVFFEQQLLLAKYLFQEQQDSTGLIHYWLAAQAITNKQHAQKMYNDLYYLFTREEQQIYSNLSITQLPEFYHRFWTARDPDHSTELNERIPEHYRRLATAFRDYRRYAGKSFNNEILYKFEHPYRAFGPELGNDFIDSLNSDILPELRTIDDLGLIYIRHGEPDNKIFTVRPYYDQNLSIEYYRRSDRPRLIFHFRKHSGWCNWMLETIPSYFEGRYELGVDYLHFSENPYYYLPKISKECEQLARIGYATETSGYIYSGEPFAIPIAFLSYKGASGLSFIDFYYGLNSRDLMLKDDTLHLDKFFILYDSSWREIMKINKEKIEIPMLSYKNNWRSSTILDKNSFLLQPGKYQYEFQIKDRIANKRCVYQDTLEVVSYSQDSLMLSDVLISDMIEVSSRATKFRKGDLVYLPHMFTHFTPTSILGIYFEIYNLYLNPDDRSDFQLTWRFRQVEKSGNFISKLFKRKSAGLTSTLTYNGSSRDDRIYFNINLSGQPLGKYEIMLAVWDKISGEAASDTLEIFIK